ncbi:methionyl-tRNA formyltransferase [Xylanibacter muris]|uniref:Methionyl-tRNA formyltransferase n=1 Tax=Xylanibacter muris TaxID=2736290 RepID=A0ABX2ANA5_9BACT|nr:methionyl-tRNA formyltransferase [Xylanibacter muris]NPD92615.1 methionyl-tRNA formyltransferase [Xylanibacter muris]
MKKEDLRIVYMGTPEFAVETLQALLDNGYNIVAVVTQPDKPVGRHGSVLQPSAVKQLAVSKGIPVLQPEKMKDPEFVQALRGYNANLQIVVAFRMLPEVVWDMPEYGTFNVHAALLPQYRGAAPINWAVINGETRTGVTTFFLDKDIDTGKVIMQLPFDILETYNVEDVYDGLMHLGAEICIKTLDKIIEADGHPEAIPQCRLMTSGEALLPAPKIFKETCRIDWTKSEKQIYDFIRGLSPYPGAWTTLVSPQGKETVLKIFRAERKGMEHGKCCFGNTGRLIKGKCLEVTIADGSTLILHDVQLAGKKRMTASDFMNGIRDIEDYRVI